MVDRVWLTVNEEIIIDTTNNTVTIIQTFGNRIEIYDSAENLVAILQEPHEIFTLSINTGKYRVKNAGTINNWLFVVREFVY